MDASNIVFKFEEEENNIRLPDEVKRETLIEDTRSSFQKEIDTAVYQSMLEQEEYANNMTEFETRIMCESSLETDNRKKQFACLLHDLDKVSRFDTQIKEIYNDDLKQNDIEIINYVCFEEQFDFCIRKNITM